MWLCSTLLFTSDWFKIWIKVCRRHWLKFTSSPFLVDFNLMLIPLLSSLARRASDNYAAQSQKRLWGDAASQPSTPQYRRLPLLRYPVMRERVLKRNRILPVIACNALQFCVGGGWVVRYYWWWCVCNRNTLRPPSGHHTTTGFNFHCYLPHNVQLGKKVAVRGEERTVHLTHLTPQDTNLKCATLLLKQRLHVANEQVYEASSTKQASWLVATSLQGKPITSLLLHLVDQSGSRLHLCQSHLVRPCILSMRWTLKQSPKLSGPGKFKRSLSPSLSLTFKVTTSKSLKYSPKFPCASSSSLSVCMCTAHRLQQSVTLHLCLHVCGPPAVCQWAPLHKALAQLAFCHPHTLNRWMLWLICKVLYAVRPHRAQAGRSVSLTC